MAFMAKFTDGDFVLEVCINVINIDSEGYIYTS